MDSVIDSSHWPARARRMAGTLDMTVVAGGVVGIAAVAEAIGRATVTGASGQTTIALVLFALATTVPLCLFSPAGAALAVTVAGVMSVALFHSLTAAGVLAQVVALYRVGRRDVNPVAVSALSLPYLILALAGPRPGASEVGVLTVVLAALGPAASWSAVAARARAEIHTRSLAQESLAGTLLEHTARGERARIARELHDVVAHHISMVVVQSESARLAVPGMPHAGAQRLSAIGDTARTALSEMRRLLGVLRADLDTTSIPTALTPQPGLAQLNDLLDAARDASNTAARLILRGPRIAVDPTVELVAYRITQEALTNARRHAPGAAVDVELCYRGQVLQLRIRDNGPGPGATGSRDGMGLTGMRERANAVGGHLQTGAAPGGGFLVEATLPAGTAAEQ
jgi:signal transduction histidine kinase